MERTLLTVEKHRVVDT